MVFHVRLDHAECDISICIFDGNFSDIYPVVFNSLWPSDGLWWYIWVNIGIGNSSSEVFWGISLRTILQ